MTETRPHRPIYLDHNATTPLDPDVWAAMTPFFLEAFGNPSSVEHAYGAEAHEAVERARAQVASLIKARDAEIIFTGTCTEANNIAILGAARATPERGHLITTQIEHPAVLEAFRALESEGRRVTYLPVDATGRVDPDAVGQAIQTDTLLVSVMAANNEVGTLQPLRAIGEICAERGVLFHSDLAQAAAHIPIDVGALGLHLASLSAHKAYGPKGIGALYVRSRRPKARLAPVLFGGGQERGIRSGTLNTPLIVGFGAAFEKIRLKQAADASRVRPLTEGFRDDVLRRVDGAVLNGSPTDRLPNSLSFSIEGVEPLALIRLLRDKVAFSASSACATGTVRTSHVLLAMFGDSWRARNAFRIAIGRFTSEDEVAVAAELIARMAGNLRAGSARGVAAA